MEFDQDYNENDEDNLEEILEDLAVEESSFDWFAKKDNTIFVIDCCPQIFQPLKG